MSSEQSVYKALYELRYDPLSGPGPSQGGCGLIFDTPPYRGPGPGRGGCGLSFDTPPYRGPGPRQEGCGLSFDTPPYRGGRAPVKEDVA